MRDRVAAWAAHNRGAGQVPEITPTGGDFRLVRLGKAAPPEAAPPKEKVVAETDDLPKAEGRDRADPERCWQQEYERRLFRWAADQVRGRFHESTWQAFWLTAVDGRTPQEAAQALGLTVVAVYLAKSRVLARLKEQIDQLEAE